MAARRPSGQDSTALVRPSTASWEKNAVWGVTGTLPSWISLWSSGGNRLTTRSKPAPAICPEVSAS